MWWYAYGWWWWWLAFFFMFFLLPLGYGWGYRGWGPWYKRRPPSSRGSTLSDGTEREPIDGGWGWLAAALWIILLVAIIWAIGAIDLRRL